METVILFLFSRFSNSVNEKVEIGGVQGKINWKFMFEFLYPLFFINTFFWTYRMYNTKSEYRYKAWTAGTNDAPTPVRQL